VKNKEIVAVFIYLFLICMISSGYKYKRTTVRCMNNGLNKKSKHKIPILQLNFYVCVAARSDLEAFNVPMRMMLQMPNEKLEEFQIYLEIFIRGEIVEKHNSDESHTSILTTSVTQTRLLLGLVIY
jgi:hypothetical protein